MTSRQIAVTSRQMGGIGTSTLAGWALPGVVVLAGSAALPQAMGEAERCAQLIEASDEFVLTRFDHRLLALEHVELAEARVPSAQPQRIARSVAMASLPAIEEALRMIGARPPDEPPS
jgi:hypothetical protein